MIDYSPKNILVVRTDRIGDVILSLPIASIIKEKYPKSKLTYLVREYTSKLVEANNFIDEILIIKEDKNSFKFFENIELIRKKRFDVAIILYPTFLISLIIFLAGIPKRIGTGYRLYSFLFTDKIYEHRKDAKKHELEYNVSLLEKIGIYFQPNYDNIKFNLNLSSDSLNKVEKIFIERNLSTDEKFIIIHPGSGGSAVDLPIEKFKELINLLEDLPIKIILTGNKDEKSLCDKLMLNKNVLNFAGLLDLDELVALISKSFLLVANSTGPIHIAAALGKCTVGFYPKVKACSVERWGPYTKNRIIFVPELECEDCTVKKCEQINCMNFINIEKVSQEIKNFIKHNLEK